MPTNRPNEDRYNPDKDTHPDHPELRMDFGITEENAELARKVQPPTADKQFAEYNPKQEDLDRALRARNSIPIPTKEDEEYLGSEQSRKDRRTVIEKLTAPPETLEEHAVRLGYVVEKKLVRHAGGVKVWWEEVLEITKEIETPDKEVVVPDGWTFEPEPNYDRGV